MGLTEDILGSASPSLKRFGWILFSERYILGWSQPQGWYLNSGGSIEYLSFERENDRQSWSNVLNHQLFNVCEEQ